MKDKPNESSKSSSGQNKSNSDISAYSRALNSGLGKNTAKAVAFDGNPGVSGNPYTGSKGNKGVSGNPHGDKPNTDGKSGSPWKVGKEDGDGVSTPPWKK